MPDGIARFAHADDHIRGIEGIREAERVVADLPLVYQRSMSRVDVLDGVLDGDDVQIAIPVELRRELGIDKGDKLIVVKRKDGKGLNLIKANVIEDFLDKISND